jgi:dienelactone hydrolase
MKKCIVALLILFPMALYSQTVRDTVYEKNAIRENLPAFSRDISERMTYPLSWASGNFNSFIQWRTLARAKLMECLFTPPPIGEFHPVVIDEQDRGNYVARKIVFNLTAQSRVLGYLLVPKGKGPFPAVLLLHDHGAKFDIGKEKVIRPFNDSTEKTKSAQEWVEKLYGGRYIGDALARRGYVCFATDALNWSDRGGAGYEGQQALASNLFNLGMSFAGIIAWEDISSAKFLANVPEVDTQRIVAMGLSMGSFRAWQVAALSDRIAGCVAVCWMGTRAGLLVPGGNLTRGQSSFTTTHPGLSQYLDYPDAASIACPKPMLIYNGSRDKLFPPSCVQDAYSKMRRVWESQNAGDKLVTKFWDAGHEFNLDMQNEAFQWLDQYFKK